MSIFVLLSVFVIFCDSCIPTQNPEDPTTTTSTISSTSTTTIAPTWKCPSEWTKFDRGTYHWCMRNYYGTLTWSTALPYCQALDASAVLTGFQNLNESVTMKTISRSESSASYLAIGGYRTDMCIGQVQTAVCTRLTSFYWTDGHTTGTDGFHWAKTQPDNYNLGQNCMMMYTRSGLMDDWETTKALYGAVCGMIAEYS